MTETTSPKPYRWVRSSFRIVPYLLIVVVSYTIGWQSGVRETTNDFRMENSKLQKENQQLANDKSNQAAQMTSMQDQMKSLHGRMDTIMAQLGTFDINPNESAVIAGGHLTVGLVGTPSADRAIINVNGKQKPMASGDMVTVQLSTTCQVELKSFEIRKAVVTTSCAETK